MPATSTLLDQARNLIRVIRSMGVYIWVNRRGKIQIDTLGLVTLSDEIEAQLIALHAPLTRLLKRERIGKRA